MSSTTLRVIESGTRLSLGNDTAQAALAARDARLAADSAAAAGNYFPSQAAGEAGTATGQFFSHPDGAGGLVYRERTGGGSSIIAQAATTARVDAVEDRIDGLSSGTGAGEIGYSDARAPAILTNLAEMASELNLARFFGIKSDGSDESVRLQSAIDILAEDPDLIGQPLRLNVGAETVVETEIKLRAGVMLDGCGGKLTGHLSGGNDVLMRVRSNTVLQNLLLDVVSTGSPGSQTQFHSPVFVGVGYGEQDANGNYYSPSNRSPDDVVRNFLLLNLRLRTNKDLGLGATAGGVGVQVTGDVAEGLISRCRVLASDKMGGGFHFDWGEVGGDESHTRQGIISAEDQQQNNLDLWTAGRAITTHPHGIAVEHCVVEALDRPYQGEADTGSFGFRTAGCYGIRFFDCIAHRTTEGGFVDHVGDLGYEFARAEDYRRSVEGNTWISCRALEGSTGTGMRQDDHADNITRALTAFQKNAAGAVTGSTYTPQRSDYFPSFTKVRDFTAYSTGGASASDGILIRNKRLGIYEDVTAVGFKRNLRMSKVDNVRVLRHRLTFAREENILIEDGGSDIELRDAVEVAYANRGGGGFSNVRIRHCDKPMIVGGKYGADAADESSVHTIWLVASECRQAVVDDVTIHSTSAGGVGLLAGSGDQFDTLAHLGRVTYGRNVATKYSGQDLVPEQQSGGSGVKRTIWRGQSGAGTGKLGGAAGDQIIYDNPAAAGSIGRVFTAAGTLGTLTGVTGTISSASRELTVNLTTDLRVGQFIAIAGVSGSRRIERVDALSSKVTLDAAPGATVSGAAVSFVAPTVKAWGTIDA